MRKKGVVLRNVNLLLYNSPILIEYVWFVFNYIWNLSFSLILCCGWLWLFLIRYSKLENSSTKWLSCWRIVELNRRIILPLPEDMICPSVVIICSDSWVLCLLICIPLSLFHSPRHDSRRRSLFMRVLSHSDTHHLNRHMVGCGCHEILLPCSTTVLFPTTFLLISIFRVEDEGEGEFI